MQAGSLVPDELRRPFKPVSVATWPAVTVVSAGRTRVMARRPRRRRRGGGREWPHRAGRVADRAPPPDRSTFPASVLPVRQSRGHGAASNLPGYPPFTGAGAPDVIWSEGTIEERPRSIASATPSARRSRPGPRNI